MKLRAYDHYADKSAVYKLWQQGIGSAWPLSEESFHNIIVTKKYVPGDHQVLDLDGEIIAFAATSIGSVTERNVLHGSLMLLIVTPQYQQQGNGRFLLKASLENLKLRGATKMQLGAGGNTYFWPGVPTNLSNAIQFFESCNWQYVETSFDLVRELNDYVSPFIYMPPSPKKNSFWKQPQKILLNSWILKNGISQIGINILNYP